jgi:hypothetical protein
LRLIAGLAKRLPRCPCCARKNHIRARYEL